MQDKLSREDFVLERFPDELLHELEKKEIKEELEKAKNEAEKAKQEIEKAKQEIEKAKEEGIKQRNQELIKSMTKKGMSKEEIASILDIDIKKINN